MSIKLLTNAKPMSYRLYVRKGSDLEILEVFSEYLDYLTYFYKVNGVQLYVNMVSKIKRNNSDYSYYMLPIYAEEYKRYNFNRRVNIEQNSIQVKEVSIESGYDYMSDFTLVHLNDRNIKEKIYFDSYVKAKKHIKEKSVKSYRIYRYGNILEERVM